MNKSLKFKFKFSRITNPVSVMKKRSITFPSGPLDTFTRFILSSRSQRTSVTSKSYKNGFKLLVENINVKNRDKHSFIAGKRKGKKVSYNVKQ